MTLGFLSAGSFTGALETERPFEYVPLVFGIRF